jgi:hypothetical protein
MSRAHGRLCSSPQSTLEPPVRLTTAQARSTSGQGELEQYITENSSNFLEIDGAAHMMYPGAGSTGGNAELLAKLQTAQSGMRATPLPNGGVGGPTPARPVIGLNERDAAAILTELELYIVAVAG